jgi:two-component system response regulator AtoC
MRVLAKLYCRPSLRLAKETLACLKQHFWPGNVEELQHALERAVLATEGSCIEPSHLSPSINGTQDQGLRMAARARMSLAELERCYIEMVLREVRGRKGEAAAILGISRKTLLAKRRRYGLE